MLQNEPLSWWAKFALTIRQCRWSPPIWSRKCSRCNTLLLNGEDSSFCCNNRKWIATSLLPLPLTFTGIMQTSPLKCHLLSHFCCLNNLFCFTVIGTTHGFHHFDFGPASVAITGQTYHCIFDMANSSHSLHWYLYDSLKKKWQGRDYDVPSNWICALNHNLQIVNPYINHLRQLSNVTPSTPCMLELFNISHNSDFAAILHASNLMSINPHNTSLVVKAHSVE